MNINDEKITYEEFSALFGPAPPMEALQILMRAGDTVAGKRAALIALTRTRPIDAAVRAADDVLRARGVEVAWHNLHEAIERALDAYFEATAAEPADEPAPPKVNGAGYVVGDPIADTLGLKRGFAGGGEPLSSVALARQQAVQSGYSGELCGSCGNFTMKRSGTCAVCETCGATTGCS